MPKEKGKTTKKKVTKETKGPSTQEIIRVINELIDLNEEIVEKHNDFVDYVLEELVTLKEARPGRFHKLW